MDQKQDNFQLSKDIKKLLSQKLFGQDEAITTIANSLKNNILSNEKAPKATYLFLGPPATGKTYLAELMTENLTEYEIVKFDMTQYHQQNGGELYGYPYGWKGYGVGQLTGFVHRNPKCIIVLDAFEKCDNIIQNNLLSIFEGGKMRDGCGWDKVTDEPCNENPEITYTDENANYWVDFTEAIFVITSSLGKELYLDNKFKDLVKEDQIQAESMILEAIRREKKRDTRSGGQQEAIIPELVSRFSQAHVVLFNKLDYQAYENIVTSEFNNYIDAFEEYYGIKFTQNSTYKNFLKIQLLNFAPELDARRIKEKVSRIFFDKISDFIIDTGKSPKKFKSIKVSIASSAKKFLEENIDPLIDQKMLIRELFRKNNTLNINEEITEKDGVISYKIKSIEFKQIKKIKDFTEDGLVFDIPNISFDDIAGHHKAKERLHEVINFFKSPKLLDNFDINPPKGMLLYGPPGTGKTMLAKAFAKQAQLPFISITGVELLQVEKTKKIFEKAKDYAPAIIFIDELDSIGKREDGNSREIPINKFLSEMDGFSNAKNENVFVIAATNYKENIDEAITRPGRIEIHIEINNLDKDARIYFLERIIKNKPFKGEYDMNKLLMYTAGFTGAQLEMMEKEASFYCLRNSLTHITQDILIEQINKIKYGEKLSYLSLEQMFEETAIYEASRAVISKLLMPHIQIEHISLTPRENNEKFVAINYDNLQENMTKKDYEDRICVLLAGRTALIKKFGETDGINTGASNDLQQATRDAYSAIAHYGMDKEVGYINLNGISDAKGNGVKDSKHYHEKIDKALHLWLNIAENETIKLVNENWNLIEKIANLLLKEEIIYEEDLNKLIK